ncbi:ABC transporter transmembrane domain-containing protein [Microbaculum sp. FT89]|uniref:ABC transporter transmembrane domain-containing protein n=1 Tax=Microbaculum sp. FT89 TaxID=3447298 RepID=UPI003F538F30
MARRKAPNEAGAETAQPGDGSANGRRPRQKLGPLRMLAPYVVRYRVHVVLALIALVTAAGATLAVPQAVRRMIDFGFDSENTALVNQYFGMLIIVVLVLAAASASRYYLVTWLGERIVADVRADVFRRVIDLSADFFDTAQSGEIVSRLTADTTQIKAAVGASASIALRNLVLGIGAATLMVVTSPRLSMMVLIVIPVIVLPLVGFGRAVRKRQRDAQDTLADATAFASENIGAVRTLQAFTNEELADARFRAAVEESFDAARGTTKMRATLTFVALFLVFASVVAVLWYGAHDVLAGRMTPGTLGQFVLYAVFAAGALGELSQVWGEVQAAAGAAERLADLRDREPSVRAPEAPEALPEPPRGEVAFAHVSFAYPTRADDRALHDVSFAVAPGETVAIVGPSGAGKSTLFHLLLRHYDPNDGTIRVDGVAIDRADPRAVRRRIAVVPQDTVIFAGTVADNIAYGRPGASDDEIRAAAVAAHVEEFVTAMPEGYRTMVGERGVKLSGGQRQRIAIARAILRAAPILLLDEATSALDAESETVVQMALDDLMQERTTLVIAHRLATVLNADRILVMEEGRIVEEGTHHSLIETGGLYARLARLQFDTDEGTLAERRAAREVSAR